MDLEILKWKRLNEKASKQLDDFKKLTERGLIVSSELQKKQFCCPICLCSIVEIKIAHGAFKRLNCGHVFCKTCQRNLRECAVCKTKITSRDTIRM